MSRQAFLPRKGKLGLLMSVFLDHAWQHCRLFASLPDCFGRSMLGESRVMLVHCTT